MPINLDAVPTTSPSTVRWRAAALPVISRTIVTEVEIRRPFTPDALVRIFDDFVSNPGGDIGPITFNL